MSFHTYKFQKNETEYRINNLPYLVSVDSFREQERGVEHTESPSPVIEHWQIHNYESFGLSAHAGQKQEESQEGSIRAWTLSTVSVVYV